MPAAQLQIETFAPGQRLHALAGEIGALAERASAANYFYEPIALVPALDLGPRDGLFLATAWAGERLVGFLPLRKARRIGGPKSFKAAAVIKQTPRRRAGMPGAR